MARRGTTLSPSAEGDVEQQVRRAVPVRDDFVRVPFPLLASASDQQIAAAVESYKREAAVMDARLAREVTLQQKATALADLCERLRADTGIQLAAGQSVADEKVTLFCKKQPLRDVMRQLSPPFGYTWLRSGRAGEYHYELVQDLRSQLLEEELRNRDRNEALLALEQEIERYRPYMSLSPDEAQARSKTAPPGEKKLLEKLAGLGWGPIHVYYRLSRSDLAALRAGQNLTFSQEPKPGERPLPPELARGILQCQRGYGLRRHDGGFQIAFDLKKAPDALPVAAVPEARAMASVRLTQSELGQFALVGFSGFFVNWVQDGRPDKNDLLADDGSPLAIGRSRVVLQPDNAAAHASLAHDPSLRRQIAVRPQPSCPPERLRATNALRASGPASGRAPKERLNTGELEPKVTTADVMEALHRATGLPIVADSYTRLYKPEDVSTSQSLFDALNRLADTMRLRWTGNREGHWLQLRSTSFYNDRLKEVPNRLLTRWEAARRRQGILTLDDLVEIAQLPDAQLDGAEMAQGVRECRGLAEWDLASSSKLRLHLRYLAGFTREQRQEAMSPSGLRFTRMPLAQQQRFIQLAFHPDAEPIQSLDELSEATLRVEYTQPGWFQWGKPGAMDPKRWVMPLEPGPQGRRAILPPIRERTPEAALQAARRTFPRVSEAWLQAARRRDPQFDETQMLPQEAQIHPTELDLVFVYIPGTSNARPIHWVRRDQDLLAGG